MALNSVMYNSGGLAGSAVNMPIAIPPQINNGMGGPRISSSKATNEQSATIKRGAQVANQEPQRGEMTGDQCFTLDLFCDEITKHKETDTDTSIIVGAIWSEKKNRCMVVLGDKVHIADGSALETDKNKYTSSIQFKSDQSEIPLESTYKEVSELESIAIGQSRDIGKFDKVIYPLRQLRNFRSKDRKTIDSKLIELYISLLISHCLAKTPVVVKASSPAGKVIKQKSTLNLVVPCDLDQFQLRILVSAINRAVVAPYSKTDPSSGQRYSVYYSLRNLVNRAVSCVAAALSVTSGKSMRSYLQQRPEIIAQPSIACLNISADRFEVAIVTCEGGEEATSSGNLLGWQRLVTLACIGKEVTSSDEEVVVKEVGEALGRLLNEDSCNAVLAQSTISIINILCHMYNLSITYL